MSKYLLIFNVTVETSGDYYYYRRGEKVTVYDDSVLRRWEMKTPPLQKEHEIVCNPNELQQKITEFKKKEQERLSKVTESVFQDDPQNCGVQKRFKNCDVEISIVQIVTLE